VFADIGFLRPGKSFYWPRLTLKIYNFIRERRRLALAVSVA
jgi:hypothetical protein